MPMPDDEGHPMVSIPIFVLRRINCQLLEIDDGISITLWLFLT